MLHFPEGLIVEDSRDAARNSFQVNDRNWDVKEACSVRLQNEGMSWVHYLDTSLNVRDRYDKQQDCNCQSVSYWWICVLLLRSGVRVRLFVPKEVFAIDVFLLSFLIMWCSQEICNKNS